MNQPPHSIVIRFVRFIGGMGLLIVLALSPFVSAQTANTGALNGIVTDQTGALVGKAEVKVTSMASGETRTVETKDDGSYSFPLLPPGSYRVEVSKAGFTTAVRESVGINVTETAKLSIGLAVGASSVKVEVSAAPALVQTEQTTLGRVVDSQLVEDLPLVTRNFTQIIGLSPGITAGVTNAAALGQGTGGLSGTFSANGDRTYDNSFQMNGLSVDDLFQQGATSGGIPIPNPDTIAEFKVQTSQYDASFGRNAGANVNVITRSGSNDFHGSVFEFLRNTDLNANNYFSNANGQPRPVLNENQYGFAVGGPIKKDRLLFFGSYQGTHQDNGLSSVVTVLSPPLTNDRSAAGIGALFAGQRGVFQNMFGGVGPAIMANGSNINPIALELLQMKLPSGAYLIPTPQTINPSASFATQGSSTFSNPSTFSQNQYMANIEFLQSSKNTINVRFFTAPSSQVQAFPAANVPGFSQNLQNLYVASSISDTWVFSPTLLNELTFGYNRTTTSPIQNTPFTYSSLGVSSTTSDNALPSIGISGSFNLATAAIGNRVQNAFPLEDTLSWTRGRHNLRFGGGFARFQRNFGGFGQPGQLIIESFPDFLLGLSGAQNGTPFSNIFGAVDLTGVIAQAIRLWEGNGYVQDDFHIFPRLTLNLGVRWDFYQNPINLLGNSGNVNIAALNPTPPTAGSLAGFYVPANYAGGAVPAGVTKTSSNSIFQGPENTIGPRIGFAFQPLPHSSRVVLRAGYGTYYSAVIGQDLTQNSTSEPYALLRVSTATANGAATFANPFPLPLPTAASFPLWTPYTPSTAFTQNAMQPNIRPGIIQQYSLNVQAEISKDLLLEVGYVGTKGEHLLNIVSVNQAQLASPTNPINGQTTNTTANIQQRVPFIGWSAPSLQEVQSEGSMSYNGLEASLTKRLSNGMHFLASYTFSKTLATDGSNVEGNASAGSATGNQDVTAARYGLSSFSRPNRFVFSYVYELPWKSRKGWAGAFIGNWSASGVTTIQSGSPLTITGTNANNAYGITGDFAELAPGCTQSMMENPGSVQGKLKNYFNSNCIDRGNLSAPLSTSNPAIWPVLATGITATGFGNIGVGTIRGPDQDNWDIAAVKRFYPSWPNDTANIEFRAEFFNAFNTPQFSNPNSSVSSSTFGQITSTTVSPRVIQFALKLNF
jgi:hypothetical protein